MRDPNRIPVLLDLIQKRWAAAPDLRFFQMLTNLKSELKLPNDPYHFEDINLIKLLDGKPLGETDFLSHYG